VNGRSRKKDFSDYCPAKEEYIFLQLSVAQNVRKSNAGKKSRKGLIM
jgi:hypothetical protein